MENIICDTNIWYDIAENRIDQKEFRNVNLYGTAVNVSEIASTPNIIGNLSLVRGAICSLKRFHYLIISTNPFDHLISIFDSSIKLNDESTIKLLNAFEIFQKINDFSDLSNDDWNVVKEKISKNESNIQYITNIVNKILHQTQNHIKSNHLKKIYSFGDFNDSWKPFFALIISNYSKNYYNKEILVKEDDPRWNRLDFFITTWSEYFKSLDIQNGRRFHDNDWHDLFNLVYVQPEFKFWTSEKRSWSKVIRENKKLNKYLFNN